MPRRASRTAPRSTPATASPSRTPVRASTAPPGSTTLAEPRKRSGPQRPVWFADATKTWFSTARAWSQRSKWRVCTSSRTRRAGRRRSTGQAERAQQLGAVEAERACRLGKELVLAEQHPEPAGRGVEGGEPV